MSIHASIKFIMLLITFKSMTSELLIADLDNDTWILIEMFGNPTLDISCYFIQCGHPKQLLIINDNDIGVNITTFGQEISLFEHHPAFQLKCPIFAYLALIVQCIYFIILCVFCLFEILSSVSTGADLARAKDIEGYVS